MADTKISALGSLTGVASGDLLPIVDVSDTTQAASGSTKKVTPDELALRIYAAAQSLNTVGGAGNYTLLASDAGKVVIVDNSTNARSVFVDGDLNLSAGQRIDIVVLGTGVVTVATSGGSPPTLNGTPGLKLRAQYSAATLLCRGTDQYVLIGDLTA